MLLSLTLAAAACAPTPVSSSAAPGRERSGRMPEPEARSLVDARPLRAPAFSSEQLEKLEAELAAARMANDADPSSEDAAIWLGRRLAYLGRYREAISVFTQAVEKHPQSPRPLRHRGHRYITVRDFNSAFQDLLLAAELLQEHAIPDEVEPDGQPNAFGAPRSTLHSNISYHLGLAAYLRGEFGRAASVWSDSIDRLSLNDDMFVAFAYWRWNAQRRLGATHLAAAQIEGIRREMEILESHAYHRLLLHLNGTITEAELLGGVAPGSVDEATILYGLANQRLTELNPAAARELLDRTVSGGQWAAFGFIAAEADLARLRRGERLIEHTDETIRQIQRERR